MVSNYIPLEHDEVVANELSAIRVKQFIEAYIFWAEKHASVSMGSHKPCPILQCYLHTCINVQVCYYVLKIMCNPRGASKKMGLSVYLKYLHVYKTHLAESCKQKPFIK